MARRRLRGRSWRPIVRHPLRPAVCASRRLTQREREGEEAALRLVARKPARPTQQLQLNHRLRRPPGRRAPAGFSAGRAVCAPVPASASAAYWASTCPASRTRSVPCSSCASAGWWAPQVFCSRSQCSCSAPAVYAYACAYLADWIG